MEALYYLIVCEVVNGPIKVGFFESLLEWLLQIL
jgi:hypothetical protein